MRALVIVVSLLLQGCAAPVEQGYWFCRDGAWVAAGAPEHAMPLKACGSRVAIPQDEAHCLAEGGAWRGIGLFPDKLCVLPTPDGGRVCGDNGECVAACLAELTAEERAEVLQGRSVRKAGRCAPRAPVVGCRAIVERGQVSAILCAD